MTRLASQAIQKLFCACWALACAAFQVPESREAIDRVLETSLEQQHVPGVMAMSATSERAFYEGAFGEVELGSGNAMAIDSTNVAAES